MLRNLARRGAYAALSTATPLSSSYSPIATQPPATSRFMFLPTSLASSVSSSVSSSSACFFPTDILSRRWASSASPPKKAAAKGKASTTATNDVTPAPVSSALELERLRSHAALLIGVGWDINAAGTDGKYEICFRDHHTGESFTSLATLDPLPEPIVAAADAKQASEQQPQTKPKRRAMHLTAQEVSRLKQWLSAVVGGGRQRDSQGTIHIIFLVASTGTIDPLGAAAIDWINLTFVDPPAGAELPAQTDGSRALRYHCGDDSWSLTYALFLDATRQVANLKMPKNIFEAYEFASKTQFHSESSATSFHLAQVATQALVASYKSLGAQSTPTPDKEGAAIRQIMNRFAQPIHAFIVDIAIKQGSALTDKHRTTVTIYNVGKQSNHTVKCAHLGETDKVAEIAKLVANFGPGNISLLIPSPRTNNASMQTLHRGIRPLNPCFAVAPSLLVPALVEFTRGEVTAWPPSIQQTAASGGAEQWRLMENAVGGTVALFDVLRLWNLHRTGQRKAGIRDSGVVPEPLWDSYGDVRKRVIAAIQRASAAAPGAASVTPATVQAPQPAAPSVSQQAIKTSSGGGAGGSNFSVAMRLEAWLQKLHSPERSQREREAANKLKRWLVIDLETTTKTEYKRRADPFLKDNYVVLPGMLDYTGKVVIPSEYQTPERKFRLPDLSGYDVLVGHNIKFDLLHLWRDPQLVAFFKRGGAVWDTMYAEYLLSGHVVKLGGGAGLEDVSRMYGGRTAKLDAVKAAWAKGLDTPDIPHATLAEYLAGDLENTRLIFEKQVPRAIAQNQVVIAQLRMDGLLCTTEMEFNGLRIDENLSVKQHEEYKTETANLKKALDAHVPAQIPACFKSQFNWSSIPMLSAMFFGGEVEFNPLAEFASWRLEVDATRSASNTALVISDGETRSTRVEADLGFLAGLVSPKLNTSFTVPYLRALGVRTTGVAEDHFNAQQILDRYVIVTATVQCAFASTEGSGARGADPYDLSVSHTARPRRVVRIAIAHQSGLTCVETLEDDASRERLRKSLERMCGGSTADKTILLLVRGASELYRDVLESAGLTPDFLHAAPTNIDRPWLVVPSLVIADCAGIERHAAKYYGAQLYSGLTKHPQLKFFAGDSSSGGKKKKSTTPYSDHASWVLDREAALLGLSRDSEQGLAEAAVRFNQLVYLSASCARDAIEQGNLVTTKQIASRKKKALEGPEAAEIAVSVKGFTVNVNPFAPPAHAQGTTNTIADAAAARSHGDVLRYLGTMMINEFSPLLYRLNAPQPAPVVTLPSRLDAVEPDLTAQSVIRTKFFSELSGGQSVNEEALEYFQKKGDKVAELILTIRQREKQLSTYYDDKKSGMLALVHKTDHCIHHELIHNKTATGRLASANPNCQNIPKEDRSPIRELFISRFSTVGPDGIKRTGGCCIEADYSQLEVVTLCALSHDEGMTTDLKNNVDFHCKRVTMMRPDLSYDLVVKKAKKEKDPEFVKLRSAAKIFSFQRQYGAGIKKLSESTGLTPEQIKNLIETESKVYAGVDNFYAMVKLSCHTFDPSLQDGARNARGDTMFKGMFPVLSGSRYVFTESTLPTEFLREGEKTTNFSPTHLRNYPVQGFAGEIVQIMIGKLWRHFVEKDNYNGRALLTNTVHDCVWVDTVPELKLDVARAVRNIMSDVRNTLNAYWPEMEVNVDFPVDVVAGENMGHLKPIKEL